MRHTLVLLTVLLSMPPSTPLRAADAEVVSGWGSHPISPELVAIWLTGGTGTEPKVPSAMVFFHGAAGWHELEWRTHAEINRTPGRVELTSGEISLVLAVDVPENRMRVGGQEFDLSEINVALVLNVGGADQDPEVRPIGRFELSAASETPAAELALQQHPGLVEALTLEILGPDEVRERVSRALEAGETPEGFAWRRLEEINARLLVPEGWAFEPQSAGELLRWRVTPPQVLSPSGEASFVVTARLEMASGSAVEAAESFIRVAVEGSLEAGEIEEQSGGKIRIFAVLLKRVLDEGVLSPRIVSLSAAGNTETNTLYTMVFEVPEEEWSQVWDLGRFVAGTFVLDDDF